MAALPGGISNILFKQVAQTTPQVVDIASILKQLGEDFTGVLQRANDYFQTCTDIATRERGYHSDADAAQVDGIAALTRYFEENSTFKRIIAPLSVEVRQGLMQSILTKLKNKSTDLKEALRKTLVI